MNERNFIELSPTEKNVYNEIASCLKKYQLTFKFKGINKNQISRAFKALIEDHPEFFWISGEVSYEWTTQNGTVIDITCKAKIIDGVRVSDLEKMNTKLKNTVRDIVARAQKYESHFTRILFVHDYIVDTTEYVIDEPMCYNSYGCLVIHKAVCAGYARAFQLIMTELGYECGYVRGSDKCSESIHSRHAWNYIKIENEYYFIDVTWDDPVIENASNKLENKTRNYFCVSDKELALTHNISKKYNYPACRGTRYNYYHYKGYYLHEYSFSAVKENAEKQLQTKKYFTIKFSSAVEADRAIYDLITCEKVYKISGVGNRIIYSQSNSRLIITIKVI